MSITLLTGRTEHYSYAKEQNRTSGAPCLQIFTRVSSKPPRSSCFPHLPDLRLLENGKVRQRGAMHGRMGLILR
jgi:hypothetical protein